MSLDRNGATSGPLKPTLASSRTPRGPLTPRVTVTAGNGYRAAGTPPSSTIRSLPARTTARVRTQEQGSNSITPNGASTNRSQSRRSQGDSVVSAPIHTEASLPFTSRTPISNARSATNAESSAAIGNLGVVQGFQPKIYASRPKSVVNGENSINQVGHHSNRPRSHDTSNHHFFHASDARKPEPAKKPEIAKPPAFFYADGKQEKESAKSAHQASPEQAPNLERRGPPIRSYAEDTSIRNEHLSSSGSHLLPTASPFFTSHFPNLPLARSPSPSKENIHLSYRKGASQIIGTRPIARSTPSITDIHLATSMAVTHPSTALQHSNKPTHQRKLSTSSSVDSGHSSGSHRRVSLSLEPSVQNVVSVSPRKIGPCEKDHEEKPTVRAELVINTSSGPDEESLVQPEPLSPTKGVPDMAAEARRERKVLDLEISNSSLLAINASLEREVRRQKAELKRFRRLSRAGRLSTFSDDIPLRLHADLSVLDEDDVDDANTAFISGLAGPYDDFSDAESESMTSGEPFSPNSNEGREQDRLARDEKRLQVDLQKHRELLVQSQMMNHSIRRCLYATEEMISGGKKALEYRVRVSDIKLGGRILTGHEDEEYEQIGVEDDHDEKDDHLYTEFAARHDRDDHQSMANDLSPMETADLESAHGLLQVWQNISRPSLEGSEGGDRDSGIEIDKPVVTVT